MPLPSAAVSVPEALTGPLRTGPAVQAGQVPAVVGRVEGGRLLLDLLAVAPADDGTLTLAILAAAGPATGPGAEAAG